VVRRKYINACLAEIKSFIKIRLMGSVTVSSVNYRLGDPSLDLKYMLGILLKGWMRKFPGYEKI
jgi:hypothetical protein